MNKLSFASVTLEVLHEVARDIIANLGDKKTILFYGEMGSGKTTLIKEICRELGVKDNMSSPTFSLVNEYNGTKSKIYHFDLYRVKNFEECLDIGMEEYLYSGNYCFIEWPDVAKQIIPEDAAKVFIEGSGEMRSILFR
ncbi:MAG: tRNA (adenosine(37)-N6)-threonylcarbamoyltransferase complex ATPase subunit type 1 TsaE [Bacteroidia bacterium]